jgi:hypothetical protein
MSALRLLALSYLASASVFVMASTMMANPKIARNTAKGADVLAQMIVEDVWRPLLQLDAPPGVVRLALDPPHGDRSVAQISVAPPLHAVEIPDERLAGLASSPRVSITILPDLTTPLPQPPMPQPPVPQMASPRMPDMAPPDIDIARNNLPMPPIPMPPVAPVTNRATAVAARLRTSLTPEMLQNFDLFLYVSKADRGPLAQRMYVFKKLPSGELNLVHDWAASTGRERSEVSPRGAHSFTATPKGYYQLDPQRMYRSYRSYSWDQDMPHSLFFNAEREGLQTGLAIHAATGDDIARLGSRASAGCVHISPQNAAMLYEMIRADYRGPVPRFAYNSDTQTMSNRGAFMHDAAGRLKMADGYRVLVDIEDYGGENIVASLF